jgi:arginine utilization protein RocB
MLTVSANYEALLNKKQVELDLLRLDYQSILNTARQQGDVQQQKKRTSTAFANNQQYCAPTTVKEIVYLVK